METLSNTVGQDLSKFAASASATLQSQAGDASKKAVKLADQAAKKANRSIAADYIRKNPVGSVFHALTLGFFLTRLFQRR